MFSLMAVAALSAAAVGGVAVQSGINAGHERAIAEAIAEQERSASAIERAVRDNLERDVAKVETDTVKVGASSLSDASATIASKQVSVGGDATTSMAFGVAPGGVVDIDGSVVAGQSSLSLRGRGAEGERALAMGSEATDIITVGGPGAQVVNIATGNSGRVHVGQGLAVSPNGTVLTGTGEGMGLRVGMDGTKTLDMGGPLLERARLRSSPQGVIDLDGSVTMDADALHLRGRGDAKRIYVGRDDTSSVQFGSAQLARADLLTAPDGVLNLGGSVIMHKDALHLQGRGADGRLFVGRDNTQTIQVGGAQIARADLLTAPDGVLNLGGSVIMNDNALHLQGRGANKQLFLGRDDTGKVQLGSDKLARADVLTAPDGVLNLGGSILMDKDGTRLRGRGAKEKLILGHDGTRSVQLGGPELRSADVMTAPDGVLNLGGSIVMNQDVLALQGRGVNKQLVVGRVATDTLFVGGPQTKALHMGVSGDGAMNFSGRANFNKGINFTESDPGPMIEKSYGSHADRYGVGQFADGTMRVYAASGHAPATVNLSVAGPNNTFMDALTVDSKMNVRMRGDVTVDKSVKLAAGASLCIDNQCLSSADIQRLLRMSSSQPVVTPPVPAQPAPSPTATQAPSVTPPTPAVQSEQARTTPPPRP